MSKIYFYKVNDEYGYMSNFSQHGFEKDGKYYMTSEHYFQSKKFEGTEYEEKVRLTKNPMTAANMGRNHDYPLRTDWEIVKDSIMYTAVYEKFLQNTDISLQLIKTGDAELIENTTEDYYWGCGKFKNGKNMLGKILMQIREQLQ